MGKTTVQARNATEASLAIRAAWLHYVGRLTQAEVAKKLDVSGVKAHRLIARATQEGAVKFVIDGDIADCVALESSLSEQYSLDYCEVVPRVSDDSLPDVVCRSYCAKRMTSLKARLPVQANWCMGDCDTWSITNSGWSVNL